MNIRFVFSLFLLLISVSANAYVSCNSIPVAEIHTATTSGFHNFSDVGVTGATVFLIINPALCTDSAGNTLSANLYMVISNADVADDIRKYWMALLATAKSQQKLINFHSQNMGITSSGKQVLSPYYIGFK